MTVKEFAQRLYVERFGNSSYSGSREGAVLCIKEAEAFAEEWDKLFPPEKYDEDGIKVLRNYPIALVCFKPLDASLSKR